MGSLITGQLIMIAEDEPLIALDIAQAFEDEGATVVMARTVEQARIAVESPELAAGILDHALSGGDSVEICERMTKRGIPFITYSGFGPLDAPLREGVHVSKPASMSMLVTTIEGLLAARQISACSMPDVRSSCRRTRDGGQDARRNGCSKGCATAGDIAMGLETGAVAWSHRKVSFR